MTDKADNDALVRDELAAMRKREVQLIGAGISMRDWHATEIGYNQLRDRIDGFILCLAALRTPRPEVDGADAQADAELVAAYPELAEHTDDPWFAVGFLREKFERSEAERAIWKERAMTMRIEPTRPQPDETETLRAEVARLREALEPFAEQQTVEEILKGAEPSEWIRATPERRIELMGERKRRGTENILRARQALKGTDHGRG